LWTSRLSVFPVHWFGASGFLRVEPVETRTAKLRVTPRPSRGRRHTDSTRDEFPSAVLGRSLRVYSFFSKSFNPANGL
jgi:hypothetical protein